jgi:hypothetical protein
MTFVREGQSSALCADPHVFECMLCSVVLMTEDHETLTGAPPVTELIPAKSNSAMSLKKMIRQSWFPKNAFLK